MNKKFISVVLAALMVASTAAISASAAEVETEASGATGKIRFDMGDWNHNDKVSFYIWAIDPNGAKTLYGSKSGWVESNNWGSGKTNGTPVEGEDGIVESYDIDFDAVAGRDVFIIFMDQATGIQTFDTILTENAIGDTAHINAEAIENPKDSEKTAFTVSFDNAADCGAHKVITSTGNIVGDVLAPNDDGAKIVAQYVYEYMGLTDKSGVECVTDEKYATAVSEFGTTNDDVWAAFQAFKGTEGHEEYDAKEADAKKIIKPTEEEKKDDENKDDENKDSNSNNNSSKSTTGTTTTTTGTTTKSSTTTKSTTTTTTSSASTASTEAAAETGDTTGTAAFAVVLVAAAAAMFFARKKVEE